MQPIFLSRTLPKLFTAGLLLMFDAPLVMAQPAPQILQNPRNQQQVFLIDAKGQKRPFRNFEVFTGCGLSPASMQRGDMLKLARMRAGPMLNTPDECKAVLAQLGVATPGGVAAPIAKPGVPLPPAPPEPPTVGKAPPPLPGTIRNAIVKFVGLLPVGDKAQQEAMVKGVLDKFVLVGRWAVAKHEGVEVYAYYGSADPTHQMVVVAFNSSTAIKAPRLFSKEVMDRLGNTAFRDVMISYSLQDEELKQAAKKPDENEMPAGMKALMARSYFNPSSFEFKAGVQLSANVTLSGVFNDLLVTGMGVRAPNGAPQFVLKAGMALDLPSVPDNETKADKARVALDYTKKMQDDAEAAKKKAAGQPEEPDLPEFFAELQMGPGVTANGPMGLTNFQLANGTFVVSTKGPKIETVGYQGNINVNMPGGPKSFLGFFEGPVDAGGAWDVLEAKFGLATPALGLGDMAYISLFALAMAPASPASKNGGPLAKLQPFKDAASKMYEPLNAVQVKNPGGVPPYVAGGDFPEPEEFNLVILGPLATMGEAKGPLVRLVGDAEVLGSNWGKINATFSESGLEAKANGGVSLAPVSGVKLGQLRAATDVKIDAKDQRVKLNGDIEIAGVGRTAELNIQPKQIAFLSKPQGAGNCVLPVDISASINAPNPGDIARFRLVNLAQNIQFPDPASLGSAGQGVANCAGFVWAQLKAGGKIIGSAAVVAGDAIADGGKEVGKRTAEGGKFVYKWGKSVFGGKDPARPVYDCTDAGLDSPETVTAHPPARLWGARDEYERGKSSGAWGRYIFSEKTGKFHPFGAKGALGATACGGLVGETGVGLGRFAADDEIWNKALMCSTIPESMKGPAFTTADQCYELRGLSAPRPDLAGKMVNAQGDKSNTTSFIQADGTARRVGGGNDWRVYGECGLSASRYPAVSLPLHEIYKIPHGAPLRDGNECRAVMGPHWKPHPRAGQIVYYADKFKNTLLVTREGTKRWIANKDNWRVWADCGITDADMVSIPLAEFKEIADGPPISSGNECRAAIAAAGGKLKGPPPPPPPAAAPPPPPPLAQQLRGQFVAYCDKFKNTHLIGNDGRRHWIANKDKWWVFNGCAGGAQVRCMGLNEVMGIPEGKPIGSVAECNALK